jgi:hypothetical protein
MTVETTEFLAREREAIVPAAEAALERSQSRHYEAAGAQTVHGRLETLFDHLLESIDARDLGPVLVYAEHVAEERFQDGYDLSEVTDRVQRTRGGNLGTDARSPRSVAVRRGSRLGDDRPRRREGRARSSVRFARGTCTRSLARPPPPVCRYRGGRVTTSSSIARAPARSS